jgi:glutamate 5-kinase
MNYRDELKKSKRIVVKIGTSTITYGTGRINLHRLEYLARVLSDLKNRGLDVVLVSSGAVGVGSKILGFEKRPSKIKYKQAAASIGQASLIQMYKNFFSQYNQSVAQILLTKEDIKDIKRKEIITSTFETLFELNVIPIVNNNDAIATDEIEFSDNDNLSAIVAQGLKADLLILLTDIDGLYTANPKINKEATRVSIIKNIDNSIENMASDDCSTFSIGGMNTKIEAAKQVVNNCNVVIANGEDPTIIYDILNGEDVGTLFVRKEN